MISHTQRDGDPVPQTTLHDAQRRLRDSLYGLTGANPSSSSAFGTFRDAYLDTAARERGMVTLLEIKQSVFSINNLSDLARETARLDRYGVAPFATIHLGGSGGRQRLLFATPAMIDTSGLRSAADSEPGMVAAFEVACGLNGGDLDAILRLERRFLRGSRPAPSDTWLPARQAIYGLSVLQDLGQVWLQSFAAASDFRDEQVFLAQSPYWRGLNDVVSATPLDDLKLMLYWRAVLRLGPYVSPAIADQLRHLRSGMPVAPGSSPRRAAAASLAAIPMRLSRSVLRSDGAEWVSLCEQVRQALRSRVRHARNLSPQFRHRAVRKLDAVTLLFESPLPAREMRSSAKGDGLCTAQLYLTANRMRTDAYFSADDQVQWLSPRASGKISGHYSPSRNAVIIPEALFDLVPPERSGADIAQIAVVGTAVAHEFAHAVFFPGVRYGSSGEPRDWRPLSDRRFLGLVSSRARRLVSSALQLGPLDLTVASSAAELVTELVGVEVALDVLDEQHRGSGDVARVRAHAEFHASWSSLWAGWAEPEFGSPQRTLDRLRVEEVTKASHRLASAVGGTALSTAPSPTSSIDPTA